MFDIQFTTEYYPELDALTQEQMAEARAFVVSKLRPHFPGIDLGPGTVTGDLVVRPLSTFVAASNEAHSRLMSDLDLGNVAEGVIYSCDFVTKYLGNFGVYDIEHMQSNGLVRLTFSADKAYAINKAVRYQFGTDDEFSLRLHGSLTDDFHILPSSAVPDGTPNTAILAQTSATTWAVDLPVVGVMGTPISRGAAGQSNQILPELIGITAAITFSTGMAPTRLPDLAVMARRLSTSATASTRNGTAAFIYRNWPEADQVSPIVTGDKEMQRSAVGSAMVLQAPAMDVYFKSSADMQSDTQIVRLPLGDGAKFRDKVRFLHSPSKIQSVKWAGHTDGVAGWTLYTKSSRSELFGSTYCGTTAEEFWLEVVSETDGTQTPIIARGSDNKADFEIVYQADPARTAVAGVVQSLDNRCPGVDVLTKAGPLIDIGELRIFYRKQPGIRFLATAARTEIVNYINSCGWPDPFELSVIYEIMRTAGVASVTEIGVQALMTTTAATRRFLPPYEPVPLSTDIWESPDNSTKTPAYVIVSAEGLKPDIVYMTSANGITEMWAATDRTVRHFITPDAVFFNEVY